ncbi:MAG: AAA family ATPase [Planctomycetota bacterium]
MRFLSLALRPYGAFDDTAYEFEAADPGGFHLVHGPNGAGKSTTLEAIRSVLFGMKGGVHDHHFPSRDLRLGAHLRRSDGAEIRYWRRTAVKHPIWTEDDSEPVGEEDLAPFLGGLDRTRFETLYGLDLDTMVEGGRELLEGEGELGRALYGAGLGGSALARTTEWLDAEIAGLYGDRAQKARLNALLREHDDLQRELRNAGRSASAFDAQRRELKRARKDAARWEEERRTLRAELTALQRLARAAVPLARIDRLTAARAEFGELDPLDDDLAGRVTALDAERTELLRASAERETSARERAARRAELGTEARADVLASAETIRDLIARRSAYEDALERVPAQEEARDDARRRRDDAASRTGVETTIDIEDARAALEAIARARRDARRDAEAASEARNRAEAQLRSAGRSSAKEPARDELGSDVSDLGPFAGTLAALERLVPPPLESIAQRESEEGRRREEAAEVAREARAIEEAERRAQDAIARLSDTAGGAPPTEADLARIRQERDAAWTRMVDAGTLDVEARAAYEGLVAAADAAVDRLRAESDRAAEIEAARRALDAAARDRVGIDARRETAAARAAGEDAAWSALWSDAGFTPLDGASMRAWCSKRLALLEAIRAHRARSEKAIEAARTELDERTLAFNEVRAHEAALDERWRAWAARVGIDEDAGEERARARLDAVSVGRAATIDLERLGPEAARLRAIVDDLDREAAATCDRLHIALQATATTLDRVDALQRTLDAAVRAEAQVDSLDRDAATAAAKDALAAGRVAEIDAELERLCVEAGAETADALRERVAASERLRAIDVEIEDAQGEVADACPERTLDDVRTALAGRSTDGLGIEIEAKLEAVEALDGELGAARETIGTLRGAVEGEGSDAAAALAERMERVAAEIADLTERYLRARLARELLDQEIERFRVENQGPLLRRAGDLMETLTLGAYVGLVASEDTRGRKVMEARRPSGAPVPVTGMSSGTQDQLYLALRIASVEQMLRTTEPMPFIADDLFVNFDDDRTEAALRVLAELSRLTQVIVFSHHEGVRESALRLIEEGVDVRVHRLQGEAERVLRE